MIFFLVKVFQEREHADAFLRGEMYANTLSYFKKIEGDDGRGDEDEGAIMPPIDGLTITLQGTDLDTGEVNTVAITAADLAAPPIIRPEWFDHINVFCMYAAHTSGFEGTSIDNLQDFKKQLEIPEDCAKLGEHAVVITNTTEFFRRVKLAADRAGYGIYDKLVTYYDPAIGTPPVNWNIETVFNKRKEFEYQREFRFAIDTRTTGRCPITLDIGEIDDIAVRTDTSEINRGLQIQIKPQS